MKINAAPSTGRREPQFVVHAENAEERALLRMFFYANANDPSLLFRLHGCVHSSDLNGEVTSFNFGWETAVRTTKELEI